jgi:hypothetical protein
MFTCTVSCTDPDNQHIAHAHIWYVLFSGFASHKVTSNLTAACVYINSGNWLHKRQDRQCKYTCNTEACLHNHGCYRKSMCITYYERLSVALVMQHAKCMRCIILSSVSSPTLPYFPTFSL